MNPEDQWSCKRSPDLDSFDYRGANMTPDLFPGMGPFEPQGHDWQDVCKAKYIIAAY